MEKNIIVAGLGHGGIATAALLAKEGFNVTVYEKKKEGTLGYDWTDIFAPKSLGIAGIDMPAEDKFEYKTDMTFFGPTSKKGLQQHVPKDQLEIKMERRDIYAHLINHAIECGVNIVYECEVFGPIVLGNRVVGIETSKGNFFGDLIIDACGMNSPVRLNLPDSLEIEKKVGRHDKITIFRAFYNKGSDEEADAKYKVMLLKDGITGVSWIASEDEYTDVLIGRFEDYDIEEVKRFTEVLRKDHPRVGSEIVRGGQFVDIPVRQPLSILVADGYAAIGDSAFMTVPVIGSGIANTLKASRMLADAVIEDKHCEFSAETLWNYQVKYFKKLGSGMAPLACAKLLLLKLKPEEVDYVFETGMITEDNITMGANFTNLSGQFKLEPKDLANKVKLVCKDPVLLKKLLGCGADMARAVAVCASMPKKYDKKLVRAWAKAYQNSFKK